MERETGIEPATNSLEGCDSTTELLPPSFTHFAPNFGEASPRSVHSLRPELRRGKPRVPFPRFTPNFGAFAARLVLRYGEAGCQLALVFHARWRFL
jgi:hypothetical protein